MTGRPAGPLLALDSSTRAAYVAVGRGGRTLAVESVDARANASSALLPAVARAVAAAGLTPAELGAVAVAGGPGSFTGLRIAAATAKGIVAALGVPLYAGSGLLALAAAHRDAGIPVCALFDARNREVYAGCWRFGGGVETVLGVEALGIDALAARLRGAVLDGARSPAEGLLWLVSTGEIPEPVADAAAWEPEYVRAAGAERSAAGGGG